MNNSKRLLALAISAALSAPMAANATNGMNLDGYGPISAGLGGTSMAYDNGTAAMMNNPATLGMMDEGQRLDVAIGVLSPDVSSGMGGASWDSSATSFVMPAAGYATKSGKLTWGVGAFAQGGMGTEYDDANASNGGTRSPGSAGTLNVAMATMGMDMAGAGVAEIAGWDEFSEVGVMRILVPVSYQVNDKLNIGGSIDFVRATMDIKMAMDGMSMNSMMMGTSNAGEITMSANMNAAMAGMFDLAGDGGIAGGYFDFADSNPYTGATQGMGFAGKIGLTYKIDDRMTFGATYHSKTSLGDLEGDATITMVGNTDVGTGSPAGSDVVAAMKGDMTINNFQWPATWGLGFSYNANDRLMLSLDAKRIKWADVMKSFDMSFKADAGPAMTMDASLFQNWRDQTVLQAGVAYQATDELVLRLGYADSNNPIPHSFVNHLFPAIVKDSYSFGFGYAFTDQDDVNFSYTMVPEYSVINGMGMEIEHSQSTWQLMYSKQF